MIRRTYRKIHLIVVLEQSWQKLICKHAIPLVVDRHPLSIRRVGHPFFFSTRRRLATWGFAKSLALFQPLPGRVAL